jgi:arylsulfatase A-like enzyme
MPDGRPLLTLATLIAAAITGSAVMAQPVTADPQPRPTQQADRKPNVIVWMMDDIGFAQMSSFGGLIKTPNIDRVANRGLRYTNYHTAPICSASRAALLTGRNPHSVHVGGHAGAALPFAGYDSFIPAGAGTLAANMKAAGYLTIALGKWDHMPSSDMTQTGPFDYWPTGQGFDKFYGFIGADADNWQPVLVDGTSPASTPATPHYHLNNDLADYAIKTLNSRSARMNASPFFLYFATGTAHAPHHAPQEWIDRYKGRFDMGWDKARELIQKQQVALGIMPKGTKLAARPAGMPAWDTLNAGQRKLYARQMEVFAAAVSHADEQFGRVLDALEARGELDNTVIAITSDNGASAEGAFHGTHNETLFMNGYYPSAEENIGFMDRWGGPETQPHYAFGWAVAGNTPFRHYKQTTHEGGIRVPLILSWPKAVAARGELRNDFAYVADIMPTILDLAGVPLAPVINNVVQRPMEGISLKPGILAKDNGQASRAQYFELYGNKGLWKDGWSIVTSHRLDPWRMDQMNPIIAPWELYHTETDPGQTANLASKHPEKVAELAAAFEEQAKVYNVNPVSNFGESRTFAMKVFTKELGERKGLWAFDGPTSNIGFGAAPPVAIRPFDMEANVELAKGSETGPIFAFGGASGGMAAYIDEGKPSFAFRDLFGRLTIVKSETPLTAGSTTLQIRLERSAPKPNTEESVKVTISAGAKVLTSQTVSTVVPMNYGVAETFDIGIDRGSPVAPAYAPDRAFPGRLGRVSFQFR